MVIILIINTMVVITQILLSIWSVRGYFWHQYHNQYQVVHHGDQLIILIINTVIVIIWILLSIWSVASRLLSGLSLARDQHGHSWSLVVIVVIIIIQIFKIIIVQIFKIIPTKIIMMIKLARAQHH